MLEEIAMKGIEAFRKFLVSIGMPINFEQLGAKREDIPKLVETFGIGDGVRGGFIELKKEDIIKIYEIAADTKAI